MGIVEEILKNKEEIIVNLIKLMEGKETQAKIDLNGVSFKVGDTKLMLNGSIDVDVVPVVKKKKK
jgi:hypothetical protein